MRALKTLVSFISCINNPTSVPNNTLNRLTTSVLMTATTTNRARFPLITF